MGKPYQRTEHDGHVHVVPRGDLIDHELSPDCVCGPATHLVPPEDGEDRADAWVVVHASLDGREADE